MIKRFLPQGLLHSTAQQTSINVAGITSGHIFQLLLLAFNFLFHSQVTSFDDFNDFELLYILDFALIDLFEDNFERKCLVYHLRSDDIQTTNFVFYLHLIEIIYLFQRQAQIAHSNLIYYSSGENRRS